MGSKLRQAVSKLLSFWVPEPDTCQNESSILSVQPLSWVSSHTFNAIHQMVGLF